MSTPSAPRTRTSAARAARAGEGSRRTWIIVGVGVVVAFAALLAIALASEESTSAAPAVAPVSVAGDPLPLFVEGDDPGVGLVAPTLSGIGLDEEPLSIAPGDGRPKVIAFFAHWCPACQAEVPAMVSWIDGGGLPDDVDVVAVSTGVDPVRGNYPPGAWFDREGWAQPTLVDDATSPAALAFGLTAYPFFVVVDADGQVVRRTTGQQSIPEIETLIAAARAGS